jgi:hypothetical protein
VEAMIVVVVDDPVICTWIWLEYIVDEVISATTNF